MVMTRSMTAAVRRQEELRNRSTRGDVLCAICQDDLTDPIELDCSHIYCRLCIQHWVRQQVQDIIYPKCPICREPVNISPLFDRIPADLSWLPRALEHERMISRNTEQAAVAIAGFPVASMEALQATSDRIAQRLLMMRSQYDARIRAQQSVGTASPATNSVPLPTSSAHSGEDASLSPQNQ